MEIDLTHSSSAGFLSHPGTKVPFDEDDVYWNWTSNKIFTLLTTH